MVGEIEVKKVEAFWQGYKVLITSISKSKHPVSLTSSLASLTGGCFLS